MAPGKEGKCDKKCVFLAGFRDISQEILPAGMIWLFFKGSWGWPGQEVTKTQTKHSSKVRLKGFASKSHPLKNTFFISISGDSENKSPKGKLDIKNLIF